MSRKVSVGIQVWTGHDADPMLWGREFTITPDEGDMALLAQAEREESVRTGIYYVITFLINISRFNSVDEAGLLGIRFRDRYKIFVDYTEV